MHIPGYPTACNPSITRWHNDYVLSFDAYLENEKMPDRMGLVWLDSDFNVISEPQILPIKNTWQDPRLIPIGDRLYIVFNGSVEMGTRRTFVSEVFDDQGHLSIGDAESLLDFHGMKKDVAERNWVPFVYSDKLLLAYSLMPHRILYPVLGTQTCEEFSSTDAAFTWGWGSPRPGTTALLDGDHYLGFFHSSKVMATIHSGGKPLQHYFIGAYTFEANPPFAVTSVSPAPIVAENFYHGPEYKMVKPMLVVFPCGFVFNDRYVWVVYGKQDHEVWVMKIDKEKMYKTLIPSAGR